MLRGPVRGGLGAVLCGCGGGNAWEDGRGGRRLAFALCQVCIVGWAKNETKKERDRERERDAFSFYSD